MGLNEVQKRERSEYLERYLEITECSQRKPYVFISYASDNWEAVFKSAVVPLQEQYGLRVYADKAFDKVNDKWIVPMLRNIRGADVVIAFVSQSYIESYACFLELLTAVNNKKQIVFVSLGEDLHLGNTIDQPNVERGVKNEILNQGGNIATNTNNTSNDLMRAMKSAYTSISTLLEQDALSKYDISDAFINFFRDASINKKTISDLNAIRGTINSISSHVFDKPPAVKSLHPAAFDEPVPVRQAVPIAPIVQSSAQENKDDTGRTIKDEEVREQAGSEAELRIKAEAEAKVRVEAEQKAKEAAERKAQKEATIEAIRLKCKSLKEGIKADPNYHAWASLILGIVANVLCVTAVGRMDQNPTWETLFLLSLICYITGFVFGIKGLKSEKKRLSIIAIVLNGWICLFILAVSIFA